MGNYNPSAPIILGEEWVGIREEDFSLAPGVSVDEVGHTFTLTSSKILADGRFYLADMPGGPDSGHYLMSVYPNGTEDQSGPVKRVVIPCNNGSISGTSTSLANASTFAEAVFSPSDNKYASGWTGGTSTGGPAPSVWLAYFATSSFSQTLTGKRILGVNLLYSMFTTAFLLPLDDRPYLMVGLGQGLSTSTPQTLYGVTDGDGTLGNIYTQQGGNVLSPPAPRRLSLGTVNPYWSSTLSPSNTPDVMPYTYQDLLRMESGATNAYGVKIEGTLDGDTTAQSGVFYLALEVYYCEEKRVAVGGSYFTTSSGATSRTYVLNTNKTPMRDPLTGALNPSLSAGSYLVTFQAGDVGYFNPTGYPVLNALRETDNISGLEGKHITVPFPYDDRVLDRQFSSTTTHILPQLSLHTSGAPLTEVHVYGRQAHAPVYGTVTATQEIQDGAAGGANSYPQVRFYARRFGDTSVSLTLDSPSIVGSSVSLTPTEFDELDEVVDGWKEITLRFTTAPSMGTGTNPQWRFSASGETAGNQWQVLGLTAPALSGAVGNFYKTVPSAEMLSSATYGTPSAGATINLGWQYPQVSATTDDQTSDAVLIFSTDPPTPANVAVEVAEQELSTVDPTCFAAGCVPTSLYYNEISWDAITSPTAISGFGTYELQRYDPVDGAFSTIMEATDYTLTTFNDYEARVGQPSVYRLRSTNLYDFAGLWSPQVTATVTDPGVVGADTTILMFTTNSHQDGSGNLAYSAAWENNPVEDYAWPEAGTVVLQDMFNKDYPTAFRPLERGGERFARQILVNASGIPPATSAHGFESLRDMAWDAVPYVCVRNEEGDRWYATVIVPSGSVRRMLALGRLCMAAVQVIEITDTPYPVNP